MIGLAGLAGSAVTLHGWIPQPQPRFVVCLIVAVVSSRMKVVFPGVNGTMSLSFVLVMLALTELTLQQTLFVAVSAAVAQNCKVKRRVKAVHLFFNSTAIALATLAASWFYHKPWLANTAEGELLRLTLAGVAYFLVNVGTLSMVVALSERQSLQTLVRSFWNWTFCYYLVGVSLAEMAHRASVWLGWTFILVLLPLLYLIYRSVRLYFGKMEQEKAHAETMASLHLRTIEALATAIEAKDECTHDHLRRVQVYSLELAKHLGLSADEVNGLQAASILHDIGKLAVPDYIISKPGKLTPAEFEKMKAHTIVGAQILEQVEFPYPVAPIVRSHHEKWDGSGYPDGLKAEDIPIGARILSAVDCLDALASDRQYRPALPLEEAMNYVAGLSGHSFDPRVVDILKSHYREFERSVQSTPLRNHRLDKDVIVSRGDAPDAGFEKRAGDRGAALPDSVAAARHEMRDIADLAGLAERLKHFVPYDCLAVYVRDGSVLQACYSIGLNSQTFGSIEIPVGQGLSGWVVENGKAIINGNPAVEPGYIANAGQMAIFYSALSIPFGGGADQLSGALTLYRTEKDAYSAEHLHVLQAIRPDIARAVEEILRLEKSGQVGGVDELTGLPILGALLDYLQDGFIVHGRPVAVLLCDIDRFQRVNERFGRAAGDELLKRIADILGKHRRNADYLARVGADEFVLLLADARPEELAGRMDSLDHLAASACREVCGEEGAGLVIGVACFPENGSDARSLMAFAEQSLDRAKQSRRAERNPLAELDYSLRLES
ncbi:MAG TPA: HD domain-containing phosphohydrolase [Bryobacteraceae bacterium]|nr:HD domain-containing phosphohydrolase [Bryobacteraceae bacterium]